MYKHILIATDGSELAGKAVTHGLELAKALGSKVTVVTVTEPMWSVMPGDSVVMIPQEYYDKAVVASAQKILSVVADEAKLKAVGCSTKHEKDQFPAEGIIAAAKNCNSDLIVMASHGRRGLAKLFLGSQAARVVTSTTIPVLIYR